MPAPPNSEEPAAGTPSIGPVRRFGRYTLIKKLATGGMAEIWLAQQRSLGNFQRFIVIKKILEHLAVEETFVRMFLDEARTSSALNHPNVVQIYDLGQEDGSYFIAMEFIAGESLSAISFRGQKKGLPIQPEIAARIIGESARALHYAHHLKGSDGKPLSIVHRDVSPQNILVTYEGEVKVVDFGIAKAASRSESTKTGMLKGKFSYMSPEQCLGADLDHRSDIFALGIVLYELTTGTRLFKHESELMILEMITRRRIPAPSEIQPGFPDGLEAIIMRALEKDPNDRYADAQEMQIALEGFVRETQSPATSADIAAYMHRLFADKISEKQRIKEIASRPDFEAKYLEAEAAPPVARDERGERITVTGLSPADLAKAPQGARPSYPGQPLPARPSYPGQPAPARPSYSGQAPMPARPSYSGQAPMPAHPSYSGQAPMPAHPSQPGYYAPGTYPGGVPMPPPRQGQGWLAWAIIGLAVLVIAGAGAILVNAGLIGGHAELPPPTRDPPPKSQKTGSLELDSVPQGATIILDGRVMKVGDEAARTPNKVEPLAYGTRYLVRFELAGYKAKELPVVMDEKVDGTTIRADLEAFPGKLAIEALGPRQSEITILVNGEPVGTGQARLDLPGGKEVAVMGVLEGVDCRATPANVIVAPNATTTVKIECKKRDRRPPPPPGSNPPPPPRNTGCTSDEGAGIGRVTLSSQPELDAEIIWKGKKIGDTPLSGYKFPAGCIELTLRNKDKGLEKKVQISVEPNKTSLFPIPFP